MIGWQQQSIETVTTFRWLNLPPLWVVGLVIVPIVIVLATLAYRRERDLEPRAKAVLASLRGLAVLLLLLAAFRPAWETTRYANEKRQIHVLVDDSASMGRRDVYLDPTTLTTMANVAGLAPEQVKEQTRSDLVRQVLSGKDRFLRQLEQSYDLQHYRFARKPLPIRDLGELRAQESYTRIGDALDLHLGEYASDLLDAVILVSDGRNNAGIDPVDAARKYMAADVKVYCLGVGDASSPKNVTLVGPLGPKQGLAKEELRFQFSVVATGYAGKETTVVLKGRRAGEGFRTLDTRTVRLADDGVPLQIEMRHFFEEPGDYTLRFEVPPEHDETNHDDNAEIRYLRIEAQKIRVLYVEGRPRWDYRYIKNGLLRVDEAIQLQCFLFSASRRFPQEHSQELEPLRELPRTRKDLFQYHVIVLGDVEPERLGSSEKEISDWLKLLAEFVELGGGVCFQAGEWAMPHRYRGTPVMDLLPVVLADAVELQGVRLDMDQTFQPALEDLHRPHEIVLFHQDAEVNKRLWTSGLPGFYWYFPVRQPKAGSEVLLRHPDHFNKYGNRVILATGFYPRGRTCWIGTDEIWRWRKPYGEKYYDRFWRNVVRWLAEEKLKRLNDRCELSLERKVTEFGQPVRVVARIKEEDYTPRIADEQVVFIRSGSTEGDGAARLEKRVLRRSAQEPGAFDGNFAFTQKGIVSFLIYQDDDPDAAPLAREDLTVRAPEREMNESSLDESTLQSVASAAGGRYVHLAKVDDLARDFRKRGLGRRERDRSTREVWDSWTTLLLVVCVLTVEWVLRKRFRLV